MPAARIQRLHLPPPAPPPPPGLCGQDPDGYGSHSADPEALMDGDGEDSVDFSSDGDVVGDATMRVLNVLGRPKRRATARKCDEGLRRGGKRPAT